MMKQIAYIACLVVVVMIGCRPAKKVQRIEQSISKKDTASTIVVTPEEKVDSLSLVKNIIKNINNSHINFKTFSAKVKVDYQGNEGGDQATAFIRMQKDSLIWVSLTGALGIEGFRLMIDQDSVKLMNKLKKVVQYRSINYLQELTQVPLTFQSLQNLIIGNPIYLDSNIVSYKSTDNQLLVLMIGKIFKNLLTLDNTDFKVLHSKLDDVDPIRNRTADITYYDYEKKDDFLFPASRRISIAEKSKLDIELNFKQYSFNDDLTFPFNIPKNYKVK